MTVQSKSYLIDEEMFWITLEFYRRIDESQRKEFKTKFKEVFLTE